jgi:hypothetical protein
VTGVPVLALVPDDATTNFAAGAIGEDVLETVRQMPVEKWLRGRA